EAGDQLRRHYILIERLGRLGHALGQVEDEVASGDPFRQCDQFADEFFHRSFLTTKHTKGKEVDHSSDLSLLSFFLGRVRFFRGSVAFTRPFSQTITGVPDSSARWMTCFAASAKAA